MKILNLQNDNRKFVKSIDNFHVLEYIQDASVSPMNAQTEYFMSKMNVRRRQVVIDIDKEEENGRVPCESKVQLILMLTGMRYLPVAIQ